MKAHPKADPNFFYPSYRNGALSSNLVEIHLDGFEPLVEEATISVYLKRVLNQEQAHIF